MIPENRIPTHPGIILKEEFLEPLSVSQVAFAEHLGVPVQRVNELIRGKRGVTPQTAWLLAQALNTGPQFWLNLIVLSSLKKALLLLLALFLKKCLTCFNLMLTLL